MTEATIHGLYTSKEPVYFLSLDALSAIDRVVIEHAIREAYLAGTQDEGLVYLENRLRNRETYIEWDKEILGPIKDTNGLEQGGCASDRLYRLVNNEQLLTAQKSELGVQLGFSVTPYWELVNLVLSAVGQADDVGLLSTSMSSLRALLHLTKIYCSKYQVKLVSSKTKLLVFTTKETEMKARVEMAVTPIFIEGEESVPTSQACHVGVVRSVEGNGPHIAARVTAHRRAVFSLLHAGLAKGHRANPAASLRVESVYVLPVLLSGLASLVLSSKEETLLHQRYKVHVQRLLRLHQATPAPVVFLLAGCLPLPAQLHLRMFSLFGQLCRLRYGDNILAKQAANIFSASNSSSKSWFWKLRNICIQYGLPHPSNWLTTQPSKLQVKTMCRAAVHQFWLTKLREHSANLPSLQYLKTGFLGLTRCHPLFSTCGSSPWEVQKATTQARLLSGRYRVESLSCHWTPWNKKGFCVLPDCWGTVGSHKGTIESFLLSCPSLFLTRQYLLEFQDRFIQANPHLHHLVKECLETDPVQFWLDASTMAPVISAVQKTGFSVLSGVFKITRNYCHVLDKTRSGFLEDYM